MSEGQLALETRMRQEKRGTIRNKCPNRSFE